MTAPALFGNRAVRQIAYRLRIAWKFRILLSTTNPLPRVGSCDCCGAWSWRTLEPVARSIGRAWLCDDCAAAEEVECQAAYAEFYMGRL